MSSFTEFSAPLRLQYDPEASRSLGRDHWRVTETFIYYLGRVNSDRWVVVPAGYLTDGASVPRLAWSLIPPWGSYGQAAVVHDILCDYLEVTNGGLTELVTHKDADGVLAEAMKVLGVPVVTRWTINAAVALHRVVSGRREPVASPRKRELDNKWPL